MKNHRRDMTITEENFFKWTNDHHYRTSSNDMRSKVSYDKTL
jgi:hypothetical protein